MSIFSETLNNEILKISDKKKIALYEKRNRYEALKNILRKDINMVTDFFNFPEDLNQNIFEEILIDNGIAGLYRDDAGNYQMCKVSPKGLPRKDGRPNKVIAIYLSDDKIHTVECTNDVDIVLCYFDGYAMPETNHEWISETLNEVDVSTRACIRFSRYAPILRVKTSKEKAELERCMRNSELGIPDSFVSEDTLSELMEKEQDYLININNVQYTDRLQYLEHFTLGLENRFYSMYGLPIKSTGKMAQETSDEVNSKEASSWLVPLDMLRERQEFCERANKLYGLEMYADFGTLHKMLWERFRTQFIMQEETNEETNEETDEETDGENKESEVEDNGED